MTIALRVLTIEDSERDVELLRRHLMRAGYDLTFHRVETSSATRAALATQDWDIILCDFSMPQFNAWGALSLVKELGLDTPFIIISGTVGEEVAVEAMLAGAHDYLMKGNLARLVPTIQRELHEADNRRARRRAEEALLESEDRYRDLVEHSNDLICTHDMEGRILSFNQASVRLLGYDGDILLQKNIRDLLFTKFRQKFDAYISELKKAGSARGIVAVQTRAGDERIWEYTNTLRTEGVAVPIVRGMARDVTEQRRAEEALRASETELRALFGAMTDVILVLDDQGRHLKIAPTRPAYCDRPAEGRIGKTLQEIYPPEIADLFLAHVRRALDTRRMYRVEYSLPIDGKEIWFEAAVSPMTKDSVIWIARDIVERKRAEQEQARLNTELETNRRRLNNIVASVPGVVWEAWNDPDPATQRIDFVSDYVESLLGYTRKEWLSTPNFWLSIIHPDDRERTATAAAAALDSGKTNSVLEFRWLTRDGRFLWVESTSAVALDEQGRPGGLRGVTIDISERKRVEEALHKSEEQLQQSQKLEAIGQLAGGIAHDFNNLLTVVSGYCGLALNQLQDEEFVRHSIEEIKKAGERAASLTRQLLAFSRKQVLQPKVIDLNSVVSEMGRMLQRLIGEDIELRTVLDFKLGNVKADPGQLEQVIMNLAVNSRDAMPHGGQLTIETANVSVDDHYVMEHVAIKPGPYVLLAISDTGVGIDQDAQAHIFEPFFTTKGIGKGTGLGLSTVYGIVKQSGGNIWVYSEVNKGTTFKIYLPRVDEVTPEYKVPESPSELLHGFETILLAEDDGMVRDLIHKLLKNHGYQVLEAATGSLALKISARYEGQIDLLLTDVVMPEISGREVADQLAQSRPEMKVLYMSGYTDDTIVRHRILDADVAFLQKPFTPEALLLKLQEVLHG
jgi:two-component system, cell cycle sensor histidine kinase and response regulator CckA